MPELESAEIIPLADVMSRGEHPPSGTGGADRSGRRPVPADPGDLVARLLRGRRPRPRDRGSSVGADDAAADSRRVSGARPEAGTGQHPRHRPLGWWPVADRPLPTCGGVATRSQRERLGRLLDELHGKLAEREAVFAAPLPGRSRRRFAGRAGADRRPGAGQRPPGSAGPVHGGAVRQECPTLRSLVEESSGAFVSPFGDCRATSGV